MPHQEAANRMQIFPGIANRPHLPRPCAVTIGNFDGVHAGHRHVLQRLKQEADARGLSTAAVIFEPQPQEFFAAGRHADAPFRLSPLRDKLALLADTGCLDAVWVSSFNDNLAAMEADTFVTRVLEEALDTRYLLVGDDFRFGARRSGDFALLQQRGTFETEQTPSLLVEDVRASSTAVRAALASGDIARATQILGHDYCLSGRVKYGAGLARQLGCPTANVHLPRLRYAPNGVFVTDVTGSFGRRRGVASFGLNPTVSYTPEQKLEVHIFDWEGSLYGQRLTVHFLHKLRDEEKFTGLPELQAKIHEDMARARAWNP